MQNIIKKFYIYLQLALKLGFCINCVGKMAKSNLNCNVVELY